jgi:hypothetical protein
MLTLPPHTSANLTNHSNDGLFLRPLRYCLTALGVTPNFWATSPRLMPDLEINVSRSRAITRSSQTSGVREEVARKVGEDDADGTTAKRDPSDGGPSVESNGATSGDTDEGSDMMV